MSGTIGSIGGSGGATGSDDVEFQILCDSNAGVITRFLRRFVYSAGVLTTVDTELDGTTAYTVAGTVGACEGTTHITTECLRVAYDGVGFTRGDRILRLTTFDLTQSPVDAVSTVYFNQNTGAALATAPNLALLYPCDTEIVSTESCYKALTSNPPYYNAGETLTVVTVLDVSNIGRYSSILTIFYNVTAGTTFSNNAHIPVLGTDIEPCSSESDSEFIILCDNNAGVITRFLRRYSVINGTASTTDTELDGTTAYTPAGTVEICRQCGQIEVLCDDNGSFLRNYGCDGVVTDTALDGTTAHTVTGTVKRCDIQNAQPLILCDDNGSFLRHLVYAADGLSITIFDTALDGTTAYTATGTVKRCDFAVAYQLLCDHSAGTVTPFLRRLAQSESGSLVVTDTALDGTTAYTVAGTVGNCALANVDPVILCDDNGSFLRHILYSEDGATVTVYDTDMDGAAYTTVGTVKNCGASGRALIQACDKTTQTTGATPGVCGVNQQAVDAVDIQDAEEKNPTTGASAVNVNDNDLELAGSAEAGETDYQIAVRFALNVPQGATICAAYIQFTSRSSTSFGNLTATIRGEAADTSAAFTTAAGMLTARTKTVANVAWNVPLWPTSSQAGADQRTPDLSAIVQEIVDRAGWVAGNNTAFFFVPGTTGYRRAQSITSGTAVAPKLHVEYVIDTPGGNTDACIQFYKEIDLSTGLETGNAYRLNAGAWEAYTPTGTVTDGQCICAGTPGDGGTDFELLCMTDSVNTKFIRVIAVDGTSGAYKKVGDYALDFSGEYTPVGAVAPCSDNFTATDNEVVVLCDDNGSFLRHIIYDANGAVQSVISTTLDGLTTYTPVGTVKNCTATPPDDVEWVTLCDDNGSFLRRVVRNAAGVVTVADFTLSGTVAYVPVGTVKVCDRDALPLDARMTNVAGTAAAATTQAIAALVPGGKTMVSLSVTVLAGTANLTDFAGTVITALPTGYSANWSADASGNLNYPASVTAAINSRVVLVYTLR